MSLALVLSPLGLTAGPDQQILHPVFQPKSCVGLRSMVCLTLCQHMKKAVRTFNSYGFFGIQFNRLFTDMIGAQEGTRTPTKLLAST
jgi:hypothetical protein